MTIVCDVLPETVHRWRFCRSTREVSAPCFRWKGLRDHHGRSERDASCARARPAASQQARLSRARRQAILGEPTTAVATGKHRLDAPTRARVALLGRAE